MLEFMHSSTRSSIMPYTNAINHNPHAPSAIYHHYPTFKQPKELPTSSTNRNHNHYNRHHNQPLQQKHRAKSVPNLDVPEIPQWITDSRSGVTYTIGQLLGRGGFAKCFIAYTNRQYFALKVISRNHIKKQSNQINKIGREVQIHSSLCHPNIVALYSTFQCSQNIYMLLEYCPNRTLSEHIDHYRGIAEANAIVFMKQLLLAVRYLHEDCLLLHRDIKPGNILLSREWTIKLADFGFCSSIDELANRQEHTVCGTPNYVAAEVVDKLGHTVYSDCWALGCTFYAMLFGRPPFHCDQLQQTYARIRRCEYAFPPDNFMVSESAKDLIRRTLLRRPEYRLKAAEMLAHCALNPKPFHRRNISSPSTNAFESTFKQYEDSTPSTLSRLFINSNTPQALVENESTKANGIDFGEGNSNSLFQSKKSKSKSTPLHNFSNLLPSVDFSTFATNSGNENKNRATIFGGAGIDSGLGGSGSAEPITSSNGGSLGKAVQFTLDKYIHAMQSVMDSFNPLNLVPIETSSIGAKADVLPPSFVAKWVDYTNKFGFGITLHDGTRSILFNDQTSLSSTDDQRRFSYKFNEECIEWSYSEGFPRSDVCDKVTFMQILREYMDRELYSSVPVIQNTKQRKYGSEFSQLMDLLSRKQNIPNRQTSDGTQFPLVHIIDYRKFQNALFIFLSDGTCQVNFSDSRYKLAMALMPNHEEPDGVSYRLHLITPSHECFNYRTVNNFEFDQPTPPFSDDGWSLVRAFQRVLQSYHQSLNRNSLVYSTYC